MDDKSIISCMYDGVTFFAKNTETLAHIMRNQEKYNVHKKLNTKGEIVEISGRLKNVDFKTAFNSKESGIQFGGSFHKWKNNGHNHDLFTWQDFLIAAKEICEEFHLNPLKTDLWKLEFGQNIRSPVITANNLASIIPRNIIYLNGIPKETSKKKYSNDGYKAEIQKGQCSSKIYDKGRQYKLHESILRVESSCKSRQLRKLGLYTYEDLFNRCNHDNYFLHFKKIFKNIIIIQPDILSLPALSDSDKIFLLQYNNIDTWLELKKQKTYVFNKNFKIYQSIIDKYASINYGKVLLSHINNYPFP